MKVGFLEDGKGDSSMARLIVLMGTIEALFLGAVGAGLAVYEVIFNTAKSSGIAIIGLGVGIFSSGALLKGWQKKQEKEI